MIRRKIATTRRGQQIRPPHRRKHNGTDRTKNTRGYRTSAIWPDGTTTIRGTQDRKQVRRWARELAQQGAHVTVSQHSKGTWRDVYTIDGQALAAERARAAAEAVRQQRLADQLAAQTEQNRRARTIETERQRTALDRLMKQPPIPRASTGQKAARHTAGGTR